MVDVSITVSIYPPPAPGLPHVVMVYDRIKKEVMELTATESLHDAKALAHRLIGCIHGAIADDGRERDAKGT